MTSATSEQVVNEECGARAGLRPAGVRSYRTSACGGCCERACREQSHAVGVRDKPVRCLFPLFLALHLCSLRSCLQHAVQAIGDEGPVLLHQARSCNGMRAEARAPCRAGVQCRASTLSRCSSHTTWCLLWLRFTPWAACVLPQRSLVAACRRSSCCCGGRCAAAPLRRETQASFLTMVRCGPRAVTGASALTPEGALEGRPGQRRGNDLRGNGGCLRWAKPAVTRRRGSCRLCCCNRRPAAGRAAAVPGDGRVPHIRQLALLAGGRLRQPGAQRPGAQPPRRARPVGRRNGGGERGLTPLACARRTHAMHKQTCSVSLGPEAVAAAMTCP